MASMEKVSGLLDSVALGAEEEDGFLLGRQPVYGFFQVFGHRRCIRRKFRLLYVIGVLRLVFSFRDLFVDIIDGMISQENEKVAVEFFNFRQFGPFVPDFEEHVLHDFFRLYFGAGDGENDFSCLLYITVKKGHKGLLVIVGNLIQYVSLIIYTN